MADETREDPTRELNIEFMKPEEAREYVLAYLTAWKQLHKEIGMLQEQILIWERRVKAAKERAEAQLAQGAEERVAKLKADLDRLQREEEVLRRKVDILKEKLGGIRRHPTPSVDADLLLAQLQMVTGEEDTTARKLKETEASLALDELKKKLGP